MNLTHALGKDVPAGTIEMPRYRSHKTVWALKIASVTHVGESSDTSEAPIVDVTFVDSRYAPIAHVQTRSKPCPEAGWYLVYYDDGYFRFSPEKKFEEGNTLVWAPMPDTRGAHEGATNFPVPGFSKALQPHQERVVLEKVDLDDKLGKLNGFLDGEIFNSLPTEEQARLRVQASHMTGYSNILAERIAAF